MTLHFPPSTFFNYVGLKPLASNIHLSFYFVTIYYWENTMIVNKSILSFLWTHPFRGNLNSKKWFTDNYLHNFVNTFYLHLFLYWLHQKYIFASTDTWAREIILKQIENQPLFWLRNPKKWFTLKKNRSKVFNNFLLKIGLGSLYNFWCSPLPIPQKCALHMILYTKNNNIHR